MTAVLRLKTAKGMKTYEVIILLQGIEFKVSTPTTFISDIGYEFQLSRTMVTTACIHVNAAKHLYLCCLNELNTAGTWNYAGVEINTLTMEQYLGTGRAAKRWVDRLTPGTIDTWDLLKKAFIQRLGNGYNDLLYKCPTHDINNHQKKWHDGTTSRKMGSSNSIDGLAALVNKLDNLGRHMKKLKESVHAIQREFGQTMPFNGSNGGKFHVGPPGYYTKTDNRPSYGEKRQSLEELLAKHQEESARKSTEIEVWIKKIQENADINNWNQSASLKNSETQIEQLTEELRSKKQKSEQAKVVIVEHEGPNSPKKLKNLHGISFLSDSQEENTNDQPYEGI
ncbi:hypothetical protein Tco_0966799 [Tanacetum coccineum]